MTQRNIQRAIVLAAGRGSRLVAGKGHPKPLEPVAGTALLVRILKTLSSEGVREAVIVVGYEGAQIRAALAAWRVAECPLAAPRARRELATAASCA